GRWRNSHSQEAVSMAIFEIQGPDGEIYEVDAPDEGAAISAFQQYIGGGPEQAETEVAQERGFGAALYDNIIGNPDDGVQSYGEQLGTWLNRAGESMTL